MRLTVDISMDDEALRCNTRDELLRILMRVAREVVERLNEEGGWDSTGKRIMDINGNSVGMWEVEA